MSFLPAFLRRRVFLSRARELLSGHDARAALALLSDPILEGSSEAIELARVANEMLASQPQGTSGAIRDLLAQLRAERGRRAIAPLNGAHSGFVADPPASPAVRPAAIRFRLAIDDAGELLVVAGESLVIGHLAAPDCDLPFLAGVEREHARLHLSSGFHGGPSWRIAPIGSARVLVEGIAVTATGRELCDGDRIELGTNLFCRFRAPVPASSSAVLELDHGLECCGAPRILLFAPGVDGAVQLGTKRARHVRVPGLEHDVALSIEPLHAGSATLTVQCAGGVEPGARPSEISPRAMSVECPPSASRRVTIGAREKDKAPFEISVAPVDELPRGAP
jgi:hypothetical protein